MKRVIEKKILPEFFQTILDGKKTYELRLGDFDIGQGDILVLKEWDRLNQEFTGRELKKEVTYVGKFKTDNLYWPKGDIKKHGLQIISFK